MSPNRLHIDLNAENEKEVVILVIHISIFFAGSLWAALQCLTVGVCVCMCANPASYVNMFFQKMGIGIGCYQRHFIPSAHWFNTCTHICRHIHMYVYVHMSMYVCIQTYAMLYVCMCACICVTVSFRRKSHSKLKNETRVCVYAFKYKWIKHACWKDRIPRTHLHPYTQAARMLICAVRWMRAPTYTYIYINMCRHTYIHIPTHTIAKGASPTNCCTSSLQLR